LKQTFLRGNRAAALLRHEQRVVGLSCGTGLAPRGPLRAGLPMARASGFDADAVTPGTRRSRSSNSVLSRSCGRTKSPSRNLRRVATPRSRVRSKAGFISTINPCGLQRATAIGACSKAARKVVPGFSPAGESDHGNGVAVFIVLLWRGTIPGRNPTMGYPIPWCS
jgi:hypothetical protein